MPIWTNRRTLDELNRQSENTLQSYLDIRIVEIGEDFLKATMPVTERTHQPFGLLHGGASVVLAEATGSMAAQMCLPEGMRCVGLEVNANHIRGVSSGLVSCVARPFHLGRTTHVWGMSIVDSEDRLVCMSRLTMMLLR